MAHMLQLMLQIRFYASLDELDIMSSSALIKLSPRGILSFILCEHTSPAII